MDGDSFDAQLEQFIPYLVILILLPIVAIATGYAVIRYVSRRREREHDKLSASRRGRHTQIDLLGKSATTAGLMASKGERTGRVPPSAEMRGIDLSALPRKPRGQPKSRRGRSEPALTLLVLAIPKNVRRSPTTRASSALAV